jgi:hypothetical protein
VDEYSTAGVSIESYCRIPTTVPSSGKRITLHIRFWMGEESNVCIDGRHGEITIELHYSSLTPLFPSQPYLKIPTIQASINSIHQFSLKQVPHPMPR